MLIMLNPPLRMLVLGIDGQVRHTLIVASADKLNQQCLPRSYEQEISRQRPKNTKLL